MPDLRQMETRPQSKKAAVVVLPVSPAPQLLFAADEPGETNPRDRRSSPSSPASGAGSRSGITREHLPLSPGAAAAPCAEVPAPFCRGEIWRWGGGSPLLPGSQLAHWDQPQNGVLFPQAQVGGNLGLRRRWE
ncbi:unnamed protein product [Rangifer tarandus platyrhynchus]|uniref:Uncharacterized protein n=1 Tax=Rangifer tarandus platyrhynchus TaxID=3082113 RepID=A0AC59ZQ06_RANTA